MTVEDRSIACRVSALSPQQNARRKDLASALRPMTRQVVPMTDGYAIRLASQDEVLMQVAEFISLERVCCPFLNFQIEIEAGGGSLWLRLSGPGTVKEFLAAELDLETRARAGESC